MNTDINIPRIIYLYDEGIKKIDFKQIKEFIRSNFGNIKVCVVKLKKEAVERDGLLFDFPGTRRAFEALKYSKDKNSCHIILTNKLFATLGDDRRPHIRASIYGFPSVISTAGIVEGPAKPKEFYLYKQKYTQLGVWEVEEAKIKQKFKARFIDYDDTRITEVLKGYVAQGLFFYMKGEPFCQKRGCRLFNAHWQEDLIYSQIKSAKFCPEHKKLLKQIKFA